MLVVLASSGIDYDVKVWMPVAEEPAFDSVKAHEVVYFSNVLTALFDSTCWSA